MEGYSYVRGISAVGSFLFKAEIVRIADELSKSPSEHLKEITITVTKDERKVPIRVQ